MLPVHHRGTNNVGLHFSPKIGARHGGLAIQVAVICFVLLPLLFLLYDTSGFGSRQKKWNNRKALMDKQAYPAAHLENLVLVAGHAVYTGLDFGLATQESSWFLESYQKVPGASVQRQMQPPPPPLEYALPYRVLIRSLWPEPHLGSHIGP